MAVAVAAGVDTWSPSWTLDVESSAADKMREIATMEGPGRSRLVPEPIAGHRVGWFPAAGLLFAEGHPQAEGLACPDTLPEVFDRLVADMRAADVPVPEGRALRRTNGTLREGFAGIRRLDGTVDLECESRREGLALMVAVAAVATRAPRIGATVFFGPGGAVQTVNWRAFRSNRILGRVYDKGLESGRAPAGHLLRPEDQRRWQKADRPALEGVTTEDVKRNFRARFEPLYAASKGVVVAPVTVLVERLLEHVDAGELHPRTASNLAGYLMLEAAGASRSVERTTRWRREKQLRELGLIPEHYVELLSAQLDEDREQAIELRPALESCLDDAVWERVEPIPGQLELGE